MSCPYTSEYFYDYDDYLKIIRNQPDKINDSGSMNFSYISFDRGAMIFVTETTEQLNSVSKFFNFEPIKTPFKGLVSDLSDRVSSECVKRTVSELETLLEEMFENKKYILLYAPFKLSWHLDDK